MRRALSALGLFVLFLSACAPAADPAAPPGKPLVVCTVGMITDAARRIGGDRINAVGLMGEGIDPHLYKASPGDIRLLSDAELIFYNGLNLEGKMGDLLAGMGKDKAVVAVTDGLDPARLRSPPEFEGHHDPHVWFDVSIWLNTVERVRDGLIRIDPAGEADYRARADAYLTELRALDEEVRRDMATIPEARRVLITAHDAFGYFGRAYGVEVRSIQGISTESEASLKDINTLVDLLVQRRIPAVFVESSVPRKTIDALVEGCAARNHTVAVGGELFSDALGKDGTPEGTYTGMVRHNVRTIVQALSK